MIAAYSTTLSPPRILPRSVRSYKTTISTAQVPPTTATPPATPPATATSTQSYPHFCHRLTCILSCCLPRSIRVFSSTSDFSSNDCFKAWSLTASFSSRSSFSISKVYPKHKGRVTWPGGMDQLRQRARARSSLTAIPTKLLDNTPRPQYTQAPVRFGSRRPTGSVQLARLESTHCFPCFYMRSTILLVLYVERDFFCRGLDKNPSLRCSGLRNCTHWHPFNRFRKTPPTERGLAK